MLACIVCLLMIAMFPVRAFAQPVRDMPYTILQPDGSKVVARVSGDEYLGVLHDARGSLIVQDSTGAYVYARLSNDGLPIPSGTLVRNRVQFTNQWATFADIDFNAVVASNPHYVYMASRTRPYYSFDAEEVVSSGSAEAPLGVQGDSPNKLAESSDLHNIVVFVQFAGESDWVNGSVVADYDARFNTDMHSMKRVIEMQSEGECSVDTVFPVVNGSNQHVYKDRWPRGYYLPYNYATNPMGYRTFDERTDREHAMAARAAKSIAQATNLPSASELDQDDDGYIDNIALIVSGNAVYNSVLWGHMWGLVDYEVTIKGKRVRTYTLETQSDSTSSVLVHEFMHVLGFPDLYRYHDDGDPVGRWDVMASTNRDEPQMANVAMRYLYAGWGAAIPEATLGEVTELVASARYQEHPNLPRAVRVKLSDTQDLVCEFRSKAGSGFDAGTPVSGLILFRVNRSIDTGNMDGPPDAYYVYREGISTGRSAEGVPLSSTSANKAALSSEAGRTTFGSTIVLGQWIYLDDAPTFTKTGVMISQVGSASGATIKFVVGARKSVTFISRGGTAVAATRVVSGDLIPIPIHPTRSGFRFTGWYKDHLLTTPWDFEVDRVGDSDVTLYAGWDPPERSTVVLSDSAKLTVTYPKRVILSGYVGGAARVSACRVHLEQSDDGVTWRRTSISDVTNGRGSFALSVKPSVTRLYRIAWDGDARYQASASKSKTIKVKAFVSKPKLTDYTAKVGQKIRIDGYLKPKHNQAIVKLKIQQKVGTAWVIRRTLSSRTIVKGAHSSYSLRYVFPRKGFYWVRAYHEDAGHVRGYSVLSALVTVRP